jgi:predicted nucleic acid-binding protein
LTQLFKLIDTGSLRAVTSELTLAETLVKPMSNKNLSLQKAYQSALQTSPGLDVRPITRDILISAAQLRADLSVRLPDAIHIATAQAARCKTFLTNDKPLKKDIGMSVMIISEVKSVDLVI